MGLLAAPTTARPRAGRPPAPSPARTPAPAAAVWHAPADVDAEPRVRAPWRAGVAERLVDVTDAFVGAPYVVSPLGEGFGQDPDPRLRFDAFDCTTFVETALALALGHDLDDSRRVLDRIRYRGDVVAYAERRHFPESEWLPGLQQAGLLVDVTRAVGGDDIVVATKTLDPARWARARGKHLPSLPAERLPSGPASLDVWALAAAAAHPERIPAGTVLSVVRVDFKNVPVRVSHQGLVVDKDGQRVLRHAADRLHHHVVDEPLDRFFARLQRYGRWPVVGVHLAQVVPAADWRVRLGVGEPSPASPAASTPLAPPAP